MKKIANAALMLSLGAMALSVTGCDGSKKLSLNLSTTEGIEKVERHQQLQFDLAVEGEAKNKIEYVVTGAAEIDENGLLKVHDDAAVGSTIEVMAKSGKVESNRITLSVKDTAAASISVVPSAYALQSDNQITFAVEYTPTYTTLTEYNIALTKGSDYAVLEDGVLKLKSGVSVEDNKFEKVEVTVSMANDATVKKAVTLGIGTFFNYMLVEDVDYVVGRDNNVKVKPLVYDEKGVKMEDLPAGSFTFTSKNTDIFEIDETSGVITPKGHGAGVVDVQLGTTHVEANVYIMIAPETLKVKGLNEVIEAKGYHYSKNETFKLEVETTKGSYGKVSENKKVTFELLNENNVPVESGETVATMDNEGIVTFKKTGKIRVTVSSDSSLNDASTGVYEKSEVVNFFINEGVNIRTQAELRNALENTNIHELNFVNNVYFLDGETEVNVHHVGIDSYGSKYFYGNGYGVSLEKLSFTHDGDESSDKAADLFKFHGDSVNKHDPFTVQFYDFTLRGNSDYNGNYNGTSAESIGDNAYAQEFSRTYFRGMFVGYNNYHDGFINDAGVEKTGVEAEEFAGAVVKDFKMENVTIRGFQTGARLSHCVGETYDVHILDSFNNGLELDQCVLTMTNTKFGQVGGFTIEMTGDGVNDASQKAGQIGPCAGLGYNEKSKLTMKGSIDSTNMNNGASTNYMIGYGAQLSKMSEGKVTSVNALMYAICNAVSEAVSAGLSVSKETLDDFWQTLIFDNQQRMNFFTLCWMGDVVMDDQSMSKFYEFKEEVDTHAVPMVSITQLLSSKGLSMKTGGSYEDYLNYKYIIIDMDLTSMELGNLGQCITLNQQYNAAK